MKVLFVSSGNSRFGIIPFIKSQGESLIKNGIDVEFFSIKGKGYLGYLNNLPTLRRHIKKNHYDIIHAHYSLTAFVASISAFGLRVPIIVSLMGSDTESSFLEKALIKLSSKSYWEKTIVKSKSMKDNIGLDNSIIVPNGVDIDNIPSKMKINNSPAIVLFAANPKRKSKNFPLAQKAMEFLGADNVILKVVFNLNHNDLLKELLSANVLLSTSLWEGSPNLIKEAMACNCPVVSTDVGDVRWLFGNESGYYITSFDPSDVADKVKMALNFSNEKVSTNGRKRIKKLGLDENTVAQRLISVYSSIKSHA